MNTEVSASSMNSIGERLRQERLQQGLEVDQIAELTKISPLMLEAIEADDFDKLPGSFFARSFVRQYARLLGLDEEEIDEEEFESELRRVAGFGHPAAEEAQQAAPMPEVVARPQPVPSARSSPSRQSLGSLVAVLVVAAACTAIYTLWQKTHATSAKSQQVSAVQTPSQTPPPAATSSPAPEAAAPTGTPLETPAAEPVATPSLEPNESQSPASEAETPGIHLELRATSEAWVRVVSDGKTVFSGVLQPNEARVFEGKASMTLRTGNAAALAATYNGKPLGELGPEGQVRTIQFTSSGFQVVTPTAATDEP